MDKIIEVLISSRFKSFYWRSGMMFIAGFLTIVANSLGDMGITGEYSVVLGLILGEVSKYLNKVK